MQTLKVKWTGSVPLIVHNGQTSDPLNAFSKRMKEITSKRKKTDADHEALRRIEWEASLYWDEKEGPIMPGMCIERCIEGGARKQKLGKDVKAAMIVSEISVPIEYSGPRTMAAMYDNGNFTLTVPVAVNNSRIIRTRALFQQWSINFRIEFDDETLNATAIVKSMEDAGRLVGLCDWRPKYGRFTVEILN